MESEDLFSQADGIYNTGDFARAFSIFLYAADQGDAASASRIACMYCDGEGVERDYDKSIKYDKKAIKLGNISSLLNLAITYRMRGDIINSKYWFERSLYAGDGEAALCLAKLYMVSDKEKDKIKQYLEIAATHKNILESSREEAIGLLK